jgi:N-methylhydantoinase B
MGPYGLAGGSAGQPGINEVLSEGRSRRLPGKFSLALKAGERLRIQTPGGGGYGAPENGEKKDAAQ